MTTDWFMKTKIVKKPASIKEKKLVTFTVGNIFQYSLGCSEITYTISVLGNEYIYITYIPIKLCW